ncbi:MAG TPA: glycosyltransferase [Acetobacteraceae bacterium]|nr:glycosyltransferase [Acetobacteraceae bacterium]
MRILVWQWGRFGGAPRICLDWAEGFATVPGISTVFSLSAQAEIMRGADAPRPDLLVETYADLPGYFLRVLSLPWFLPWLIARVRRLRPDIALCAMPGPLDFAMYLALRRLGVPMAVAVHDADAHPGDGYPLQMRLQRALVRRADAIVALSDHVARRLVEQGMLARRPLLRSVLPLPRLPPLPPARGHGGPFRLLCFGRLLAYKGLDLLALALARLLPDTGLVVRVVGSGPEGPDLQALRALPGVTVENRWVPEAEIPELLAWADGLVLSHREASQSGVAVAALAARRLVVATRVGALAEQLGGDPAAVLCDVSVDGLTAAIRHMLTLPPPPPRALAGDAVAALAQDLVATLGSPSKFLPVASPALPLGPAQA